MSRSVRIGGQYALATCRIDGRSGRASLARARGTGVVRGRGASPSRASAGSASSSLRLTHRGRMVVLALLLAVCGVVAVWLAPAGRAADPVPPPVTAVVQPGDTLWSFVERNIPSNDAFGAINDVRRLNRLESYTIQPGQRLLLPRRA